MKNNKKIIFAVLLMAGVAGNSYAQQVGSSSGADGQADRKVEVSREYVPEIGRASKLYIEPDMVDTAALRPDFDYSIKPTAWPTGFGVLAINPVKVSASQYDPQYPFYIKVGGGLPGQSLLDFYATSKGGGKGVIGAYINHYGRYANVKNDLEFVVRGLKIINSGGVFGKLNVGKRMSLEGELGFDYNIWSRYGRWFEYVGDLKFNKHAPRQSYSTPRIKVFFGNDFKDLSYFNFRLGAQAYYIKDREKNAEKGMEVFAEVGKMFSIHKLTLKAGFRGAFGADSLKGYYDRIFTFAPGYGIVTKKFKLDVGADIIYNSNRFSSSRVYILPQAKITFDAASWFTPFVTLDSRMVNNGFRSLTDRNPYILGREYVFYLHDIIRGLAKNTREYNLRGGISGSIANNFAYRLYAGVSLYKNPVFFVNNYYFYYTDGFAAINDKRMTVVTGGVELDGHISGSFTAGLAARFYDYSLKTLDHASGLPNYEASLYLRYNYREKLFLTTTAKLIGDRRFLERNYDFLGPGRPLYRLTEKYTNGAAAVDLSLEVEYRPKKNLGIFAQGNNLANSKLYIFNHYPDQGASVNAGIKLIF